MTELLDTLKGVPQWVCWRYEERDGDKTKPPIVPRDTGKLYASTTDKSTWGSYEEARTYHERVDTDTEGVGFVLTDDDVYAGADLDGCRDPETGDIEPWAEDVVERLNSYTEVSPSGTGLRVFVLGFMPGDSTRAEQPNELDATAELDKTTELEMYDTGRYLTFTGNHLDDTPTDAEQRNDAFHDVHAEFIAEDDEQETAIDDYDSEEAPDLDFDDEEILERARDASNGEKFKRLENGYDGYHNDDTSRADKAFCQMLAFWTGGDRTQMDRLFRNSGRMRSKWDEVHSSSGDTYGEMTIQAALDDQTEYFDPSDGGTTSDPDPSEIDYEEVERGEAILQAQTASTRPAGELQEKNGCYGVPWETRDEDGQIVDSGLDTICNFTLESVSFLGTDDGTDIRMRVIPQSPTEEPYTVRVQPEVFNGQEQFKAEVVTGRTTWFDSSNRTGVPTQTILRYLRETVGEQPAPHRTGTAHIGLSEDGSEFVTPEGSLTADGWEEDPDYEFYTKGGAADEQGALAQKWELAPCEDTAIDEEAVGRIAELLPQTRAPDRGLPILGWFYAAPLKAYIHQWEQEFPILSPHGDTGTGKTSTIETFLRAFGGTGEPLSSTDTRFTLQKHLAESRGLPVWIDEYKPTEMPEGKLDHLHQRLKEVTKERSMPKGRPDLGVDMLWMRAPVILSGEQKIADPPVRRRSIMTNLTREPTRDGTETKAAFGELTGVAYETPDGQQHHPDGHDLREHARAFYRWLMARDEQTLKKWWYDARDDIKQYLSDFGVTVEESEQRGLQTVVFGAHVHREFATDYGADADELPSESEIRDAVAHVISNIGKDGHRREHADDWLELLTLAATEDYVEEGIHYRLVDVQDIEDEALAVHMPTCFTGVKKYLREYNLEEEYTLLNKTDYLDSFRNKADVPDEYVLDVNKRVRGIENGGKATFFDPRLIADKLGEDFNLAAFTGEDQTDIDATQLAQVSPGEMVDVTVACVQTYADPRPWLEQEGFLHDESGWVMFQLQQDNPDYYLDEGEVYRIEDAVAREDSDGVTYVEIVPGVSTIGTIDLGDGHTDPDGHDWIATDSDTETDEAQTAAGEGADEDSAAADGGRVEVDPADDPAETVEEDDEEPASDGPPSDAINSSAHAENVVRTLRANGNDTMTEVQLIASVTSSHDMTPEEVRSGIGDAVERGNLIDDGGKYRLG